LETVEKSVKRALEFRRRSSGKLDGVIETDSPEELIN
jgi:hypothetical protein